MKHFELTEEQELELSKWKETIKTKYGKYGLYVYKFTPNALSCPVEVFSIMSGKSIVLKDSREI